MRVFLILLSFLYVSSLTAQDRQLLRIARSNVTFISDAPLEHITATNTRSSGLIDVVERSFAFQIPVLFFEGFNSPLQKEHFNENYMESRSWPNATFQGRMIETVDLSTQGTYSVRAKGVLRIHGVERERIVLCQIHVAEGGVRVVGTFDVVLDDHGISVPRVVQQKIASVVQVKVDALFINSAN